MAGSLHQIKILAGGSFPGMNDVERGALVHGFAAFIT
jgi:hypothetical protein